jgi:hypothetical protein
MPQFSVPLRLDGVRYIHRLILLRYGISAHDVLNQGPDPSGTAESGVIAADLLRLVRRLKAAAIREDGLAVDYARLKAGDVYAEYRSCAQQLQYFDPNTLSAQEEKLAFWINLYNALIVDAVIQFGVKSSVTEAPGFFWRAAYAIGGRRYAAFDIEYGILRANAGHPGIPGPQFGGRDPRRRYALPELDPRIHFALVCAAHSCPPISVYDPGRIDAQLDLAARSFVNGGGVTVDVPAGEVALSKIFQWYAPDFGARPLALGDKKPLLDYVAPYLVDEAQRGFVLGGRAQARFLPYDWSLNINGSPA